VAAHDDDSAGDKRVYECRVEGFPGGVGVGNDARVGFDSSVWNCFAPCLFSFLSHAFVAVVVAALG